MALKVNYLIPLNFEVAAIGIVAANYYNQLFRLIFIYFSSPFPLDFCWLFLACASYPAIHPGPRQNQLP